MKWTSIEITNINLQKTNFKWILNSEVERMSHSCIVFVKLGMTEPFYVLENLLQANTTSKYYATLHF